MSSAPAGHGRGVRVYTTRICPYCVAAKNLLESRGIAFEEVDVTSDPSARTWIAEQSGQRTVPQIFFGQKSIGGFQELAALDREGRLDDWSTDNVDK